MNYLWILSCEWSIPTPGRLSHIPSTLFQTTPLSCWKIRNQWNSMAPLTSVNCGAVPLCVTNICDEFRVYVMVSSVFYFIYIYWVTSFWVGFNQICSHSFRANQAKLHLETGQLKEREHHVLFLTSFSQSSHVSILNMLNNSGVIYLYWPWHHYSHASCSPLWRLPSRKYVRLSIGGSAADFGCWANV